MSLGVPVVGTAVEGLHGVLADGRGALAAPEDSAALARGSTGLAERGVGFHWLQENIDTTTPGGRLVFHVFAALAEFERDLIHERTRAGLAAARARGRRGGRPSVMTADKRRRPADVRLWRAYGRRDRCGSGRQPPSIYRHLGSDTRSESQPRGRQVA
jgi:DNA invertase Pin-like site-specific DNA recombinase